VRIVLATSDLAIGGAERNVVTYACALRRRGHDVVVAAGDGPLAEELRACGVARLRARPHLRHPWTIASTGAALRALHARERVEVVHAFMASASAAASLGRFGLRRPYAVIAAPPGLAQSRNEPTWVSWLRLRVLSAGADMILAPSHDLRAHLLSTGVKAHKIRDVDFNAVDLPRFDVSAAARVGLGVRPGERVVCSVARLHQIKGQDQLIRAAARIREHVPQVRILLVGDGPQRAQLERLAGREGVADVVTFLGARSDVPAILRAVDVVVQTTFGTGGPGLAVLEAFAAERPVVGFAFGDLRDAVAGSGTALLVEHGDFAGLALAIAGLLLDPDRARAMGRNGRALVEQRYDMQRVVDQLEEVYREVAAREYGR